MPNRFTHYLLAVLLGIGGFLLAGSVYLLIVDHQRVSALWDLEIRRAQAQSAQSPQSPAGK